MIAVTTHTVFIKRMDVSNPVCQSRMNNWSQILVPMSKPDRIPALGRLTLEDVGLGVIQSSKSVHSRLSERPCVSQRRRAIEEDISSGVYTHIHAYGLAHLCACMWTCTCIQIKQRNLRKCGHVSGHQVALVLWTGWHGLVANCFHFRTWEVWLTGSAPQRSFPVTDLGLLVRVALSQMG